MERYTEAWAWDFLGKMGLPFFRTGSREMCNPAPTSTDVDFVVLDLNNQKDFYAIMRLKYDFEDCGEEYGGSSFEAIRKGEVNLIIVCDPYWFSQWQKATHEVKKLNILDKSKRIAAFESIYDPENNSDIPL